MADGDELISTSTADLLPHQHMHLEVLEMNVELGFVSDRVVTLSQIEQASLCVSGIVDRFANRIKP
jgi:hypothetical protein